MHGINLLRSLARSLAHMPATSDRRKKVAFTYDVRTEGGGYTQNSVQPHILVCPGWSAWAALLNTRIENENILVFGSAAQADLPNRTRIFGRTLPFLNIAAPITLICPQWLVP